MSGQTIKLPDIQVPGTSVILTNVTVTVEPMLPKDTIQMAVIDWIVNVPECDIVLGSVRSRQSLIPCASYVGRLLAILEVAEGSGKTIELVVSN